MDDLTGRLLVVDDDENNRDMLSRRLQRRGFDVAVAVDGPQALGAIAREAFDLVLLDIEMPGMSGFEVLRQLRKTQGAMQLPVIMATARGDRADIVEALSLGANDHVTKPLDFPVVLARVETQLSHKRAVDRIRLLEADLRRQNEALERANGRMQRSLQLAASMQRSLLPAAPSLRVPGLHFEWLYDPCDELGGDILNVCSLGPRYVGLYLLDVSGHGVPAALLSVTLSRMLSPVANQASLVERLGPDGLRPTPPVAVAEELNRRFQMTTEAHSQFFTMFYGVLDLSDRKLRYVSAGHPPAVILRASGALEFLGTESPPVGCFEDARFEEGVVALEDSDRFYLYSDGVTETMTGERELFGTERLVAWCRLGRGCPLQQSLQTLACAMSDFRGPAAIHDDVSALAMEVLAGEPSTGDL